MAYGRIENRCRDTLRSIIAASGEADKGYIEGVAEMWGSGEYEFEWPEAIIYIRRGSVSHEAIARGDADV